MQGEPAGCLLLQGSSGLCFSEASSPAQSSALEETAALLWAQACPGPTCTCCSHPRTQAAACPEAPQAAGFLESVGTGLGTHAQGPGCGFGVRELAQGWGPPTAIPMTAVSPVTHHCIPRRGALSRHLLAPANRIIALGIPQWARRSVPSSFWLRVHCGTETAVREMHSLTHEDFR